MATLGAKALILVHLSILLLSSFTVFGDEDIVSWVQAPHISPVHPPAPAPKPHKGHHHHKNAPAPAPVKPPVKPPTSSPPKKPPSPPPAKPPTPPAKPPTPPAKPPSYPVVRKLFAVQGVVYCKSCKYRGIDTLSGATPLVGQSIFLSTSILFLSF